MKKHSFLLQRTGQRIYHGFCFCHARQACTGWNGYNEEIHEQEALIGKVSLCLFYPLYYS
ncbi:MAG: hypothetical protein EOP46_01350 [Sphingobacteriaceae bacterium]|nr:MAG: hypothetical protein EOP46_01350 [Sphingobacteriaceae bacterium]